SGTTRSRMCGLAHLSTGGRPMSSEQRPDTRPVEPQRISSSLAAILANRSPSWLPPNCSGKPMPRMPASPAFLYSSRGNSSASSQSSMWGRISRSTKRRTESRISWWDSSKYSWNAAIGSAPVCFCARNLTKRLLGFQPDKRKPPDAARASPKKGELQVDGLAARQGVGQGAAVHQLQLAAQRHAVGDARHHQPLGLQQLGDVVGRGLTFH